MQSIDAGLAKFAEHDVGVRACLAGLDGSDDVTAIIADALRAHEWGA